MVLLNPRTSVPAGEVATVSGGSSTNATAAWDDSNQEADTAPSTPAAAAAPAASPAPVEATAPATSSVSLGAAPTNPATAESPSSPAPETLPVQSPASDPIASASGSDTSQDNETQQMIGNMQRMFEQQMMQRQTSVPHSKQRSRRYLR